jgi:CheY-like chemotaxis protein
MTTPDAPFVTGVTGALVANHRLGSRPHESVSNSNTRDLLQLIGSWGSMILCVDDEPTGLMVRKILLERQGYEVITALSGPEGLQLLMAHPVEAVVLDYAMPGMNGDQVAAAMKRLKPEVKILLFSAYVDLPEEALKWVDKRAVKGVSPMSFLEDLQQLLSS